jgi:hypothetical protein
VCNSLACAYDGGDCWNAPPTTNYQNTLSNAYATFLVLAFIPVYVLGAMWLIGGVVMLVYHNNRQDLRACGVLWLGPPKLSQPGMFRPHATATVGGMVTAPAYPSGVMFSSTATGGGGGGGYYPPNNHVMMVQPVMQQQQQRAPQVVQAQIYQPPPSSPGSSSATDQSSAAPGLYPSLSGLSSSNPQYIPTANVAGNGY